MSCESPRLPMAPERSRKLSARFPGVAQLDGALALIAGSAHGASAFADGLSTTVLRPDAEWPSMRGAVTRPPGGLIPRCRVTALARFTGVPSRPVRSVVQTRLCLDRLSGWEADAPREATLVLLAVDRHRSRGSAAAARPPRRRLNERWSQARGAGRSQCRCAAVASTKAWTKASDGVVAVTTPRSVTTPCSDSAVEMASGSRAATTRAPEP